MTAGDFRLDRVPGDFPDEAVYQAAVGEFTLWLKSSNGLEGPWDWVIEDAGTAIDLGGPFATRELAGASLAAEAAAAGIGAIDERADDVVTIPAAAPPAPAPAALDIGADPEVMGLALDLAIVALRRARARLPVARAA